MDRGKERREGKRGERRKQQRMREKVNGKKKSFTTLHKIFS